MARLLHLRTENFKKISVIDVDFADKGNLVTIVGDNDSGKTSLIDSIAFLFGGAKFAEEMPIRIGEELCQIMGRLDNGLIMKRRVTDKSQKLTIESEDGAMYKSPQDVADALYDPIAFEPDAFTRLSTREQAIMLRKVIGVDTSALDSRRKTIFEERTKINAEAKFLVTQAEAMTIPIPPVEVGEEIDIAAVAQERAAIVKKQSDLERAGENAGEAAIAVAKAEADIKRIEDSLAKMREALATKKTAVEAAARIVAAFGEVGTTDELDAKIATANSHNAVVRGNVMKLNDHKRAVVQKTLAEKKAKDRVDDADKLTEQLEAIDEQKTKILESANFPVPGMSVVDDEVYVNGVPFSQIASSEQLRIGMAMAMASKAMQSKKAVRICLIRDGDRIGDAKRAIILQWAIENDIVIFEERVARPGIVGIEIEDGHLKGVELPKAEEAAPAKPKRKPRASAKDMEIIRAGADGKIVAVDEAANLNLDGATTIAAMTGEDPPE